MIDITESSRKLWKVFIIHNRIYWNKPACGKALPSNNGHIWDKRVKKHGSLDAALIGEIQTENHCD